jgi:FkbH-like protein
LNSLAESGTLVGIASKNDANLVKQALARSDLVLRPDRIFPIEAHWKPKSESVRRTLETWNIAPDSVVFVDDSPLELEEVKVAFPAIECIRFCKDDPAFLIELRSHFAKRAILEEDALRSESLRAGASIRESASDAGTYDALLAGANAKITFRWQKTPEPRALELINKTNQFNLNGVRYSEAEWNRFVSKSASRVVVAEYEDRFGKLGKIAVIAGREEGGAFCVHAWVMSCRAFSRRIEHQCLKALLERWDLVVLQFKRTERNGPLQDFLAQIGNGHRITRQNFEKNCPKLFHETEVIND